jgi:hypothetical protein
MGVRLVRLAAWRERKYLASVVTGFCAVDPARDDDSQGAWLRGGMSRWRVGAEMRRWRPGFDRRNKADLAVRIRRQPMRGSGICVKVDRWMLQLK